MGCGYPILALLQVEVKGSGGYWKCLFWTVHESTLFPTYAFTFRAQSLFLVAQWHLLCSFLFGWPISVPPIRN